MLFRSSYAITATLILNTTIVFWISSGAVMTDHTLLTGTTICMVTFWHAMKFSDFQGKLWGYVFFGGLAMGLLAKGPVALVLTLLPIAGWTLMQRKWHDVWQRMPWITGLLVTAALSLPWYWMAEIRTPGFLEYFLIGEHWKRFLVPGWEGDLYGSAHLRPRGTIWLYWVICTLPWSIVLLLILIKKILKSEFKRVFRTDDFNLYLILWALTPIVFFTLSRNILPAYVLPGIPALALLIAQLRETRNADTPVHADLRIFWPAYAMTAFFVAGLIIISHSNVFSANSQKDLAMIYQQNRCIDDGQLVYLFSCPYSARFYSMGKAGFSWTIEETEHFFNNGSVDYFAVRANRLKQVSPSFAEKVINLGVFNQYYLLKEKNP